MIEEFLSLESQISEWYDLGRFWDLKHKDSKTLKILIDTQKIINETYNDEQFSVELKYNEPNFDFIKTQIDVQEVYDFIYDFLCREVGSRLKNYDKVDILYDHKEIETQEDFNDLRAVILVVTQYYSRQSNKIFYLKL